MKKEIINKIKEFDKIIIHTHVNPDPDAYGSQGGLQKILKSTFPHKEVYIVGETVDSLKFLSTMDTVPNHTYEDALVIVCDTANTERIADQRYDNGKFIIKIDHHPNGDNYGELEWVDTSYSSCSEMITELYLDFQDELTISDEAARLLYAGIVGDTGRFLYNNTTPQTLKCSSELLSYDFDPQEIYEEFYKKTKNVAKFEGKILSDFSVTEEGVAYFKITNELIEQFKVQPSEAANLVNVLKDVEGNKIWVFFVEYPDEIRVRIRSSHVKINEVAKRFKGGGHPLASGASIGSWNEVELLIGELNKLLK